jgi:hypothetical protein
MSALAVLLISGAGIAFAGTRTAAAPAAVIQAAAPAVVPAVQPTTEPVETTGPDTDTLQQGDQTSPDSAVTGSAAAAVLTSPSKASNPTVKAAAAPAATEAPAGTEATGTEAAGTEEPGDASLPGGGHADNPNDPNADHQFDGVE